MLRVVGALLCAALGVGAGYAVWGIPAVGLEEALDHLAIENDQLRTRLAEPSNFGTRDVSASIDTILRRISEQSETLRAQAQTISDARDRETGEQMERALQKCESSQVKLQDKLETCLFAKADLERSAGAKKPAPPPRAGSQTVTETIERPAIPEGAAEPVKPGGKKGGDPTGSER
jgi:hypothetical protein